MKRPSARAAADQPSLECPPVDRPLCSVLIPRGSRADPASGRSIDFEAIYGRLVRPAVEAAGLEPLRAGDERPGSPVDRPSLERFLLSEYAVADLTAADAAVCYRFGARQALRPRRTVQVCARGCEPPLALDPRRGLTYGVGADGGPEAEQEDRRRLTALLRRARQERRTDGNRLVHLVDEAGVDEIKRLKTDVFRDQVEYSAAARERLAEARRCGVQAVLAARAALGPLAGLEAAVAIDLLLSFRAVGAWREMLDLVEAMPGPLARSVMVREQYALALNRAGEGERAERVLLELLDRWGPNSETCSILGRVYKDRWQAARDAGRDGEAAELLDKAIETYLAGFESDWRDAFPGINAVNLMEFRDEPDRRREELLGAVSYAVRRRVAAGEPDYWDHATLLELAVLGGDRQSAAAFLERALAAVRETWEPESTARTLVRIRDARRGRGEEIGWLDEIAAALEDAAGKLPRDCE